MTVDERKQKVLEAIVALYAMDGEPVGSSLLASHFDMAVSSATLRNEMAALTKLGLLEQPHTSAGRVPSPAGYRFYLDRLLARSEGRSAQLLAPSLRAAIDESFSDLDIEPEKLVQSAAKSLSDLTGMAAAACTPRAEDLCVAHFEVVQVGRYSAAILAVTSAGGVRTRVARVDTGLTRQDATHLAQLLNSGLTFVSPADLTPRLLGELVRSTDERFAAVVTAAAALVRARPKTWLEGAQNLVKWGETRQNLSALLGLFANETEALRLIATVGGRTTVTLGEDLATPMPELCVLSKRYLAGGGQTGSMAIIGPQRMDFSKLIPVLDYYTIKLGQCMSGQNQEDSNE